MQLDTHKTKVIFRKFREGDVIALFPELAGTNDYWGTCLSYQHLGQHGSASIDLMRSTKATTYSEHGDLMRELQGLGYNLLIVKKFTRRAQDMRKRQVRI